MTLKTIEVGVLKTNCTIMFDETSLEAIIFDPGADYQLLLDYIEKHQLNVTHILITHGHFDHIGGVLDLQTALKEEGQNPLIGMRSDEKADMDKRNTKYETKDFIIDIDLKEITAYNAGQFDFDLIELPGHTNHSVCFYSSKHSLVIAGDTLFYHTIGTASYYDGPNTDLGENITKYLFVLPLETVVYPGHGPSTTIEEEVERNPYLSDADTIDPWL